MNAFQVEIRVPFRAGHRLMPPYKGKCNNPHGEGFTAIVIVESPQLDENGMVIDFGELKKFVKQWIDDNWDHAFILNVDDSEFHNFLVGQGFKCYNTFGNPTSERLAVELYNVIDDEFPVVDVVRVGIVESFRDSVAWYGNKML